MGTYQANEYAYPLGMIPRRRVHGDDAGTREFIEAAQPHMTKMLRLARRLGRDNAEDIVQEALARAWERRTQYDPGRGSLGAWLLSITADQAYKSWRWSLRHDRPIPAPAPADDTTVELLDLDRALRKLSKRQRLAVDSYYFAGLTVEEVASVMGCSTGTVKSTLSDARAALRRDLR